MPNKLEQTAITLRSTLINLDTYRQDWSLPADTSNNYTVTHTRALADAITPVYGKGTGKFLDTADYNGGSSVDRYKRIEAIIKNVSDGNYGPGSNEIYNKPDTSLNVGKFKIR